MPSPGEPSRATRRRLPPPPRARPPLVTVAWIVVPGIVAAAATYGIARSLKRPPPAAPPVADLPERRESPFFEEIFRLEGELRFGEAIQKLDEFSPRLSPEPEAALRVEALRPVFERKARELQARRVEEAKALAVEGKFREAADRLADVGRLGVASKLAPLVTEAYQALRRAAEESLAARRRASLENAEREIARSRDDGGEPGPERARRRFEAGDFAGVLADARRMERIDPDVHRLLAICATRAPLDEAVRRLYEEALEKTPTDRSLWAALGTLHTWRQDAAAAAEVVKRAEERKVNFDPSTRDLMELYRKLKQTGLPPGKPVYVDFVGPYEIVTDTDPERARRLADELDRIAREYAARFPWSRNPDLLMRVLYFEQYDDFREYYRTFSGRRADDVAAVYFPPIKQLVVSDFGEDSIRVLRHEAFHQWLDLFAPQSPNWFHEGMASFMERSEGGKAAFDDQYHRWSMMGMTTHPTIPALLSMSSSEWHDHRPSPALLYGQSWSFIYFLHRRGKASMLDEFLSQLALGKPVPAATTLAFGSDLSALERDWKAAVLGNAYDPKR